MVNKKNELASPFSRSVELLDNDPLEEIFALNLGDFLTEHLISNDLAQKIVHSSGDKIHHLKEQLNELISIYSIDNTLRLLGFNSKEEYVIYNSIAQTLIQMIESDVCQIFLSKDNVKGFENSNADLILVGSSQKYNEKKSNTKGYLLSDLTPITKAFNSKKSIEIKYLANKEFFFQSRNDEEINYCFAFPMYCNCESIGVIFFANYDKRPIKEEYRKLLEITAKLFAISMILQKKTIEAEKLINDDKTQLFEFQHLRADLTGLIGDLGERQQNFVEALAVAVDKKGNYEYSHSQAIANLSKELCEYLELNEKTKDLIYYAGLLQNIGKITLPQELFNKKSALSNDEWKKLQTHPNIGVNLLMNINFMSEVIPYIHYNKERWDGNGEPEGLKGNSIPLGSRIIAVCDAYCAMISNRSYRKAMSSNEALTILQKEAMTKWDPILIDALTHIIKEKNE